MMMLLEIGIVSGGLAVEGELAHQARFHQRVQSVIYGCPRGARMPPVERRPQLFDRRVFGPRQQMLHDKEALRSSPDARPRESGLDADRLIGFGFCSQLRIDSNIAQSPRAAV